MFAAKLGLESEDKNFILTETDFDNLLGEFNGSVGDVQVIEESTREQANCQLWKDPHNGRLTSSWFGELLHRRSATCPSRLVKEMMGYLSPVPSTPAIRRGKNNEKVAGLACLEFMASSGQSVEWYPCGLHLRISRKDIYWSKFRWHSHR